MFKCKPFLHCFEVLGWKRKFDPTIKAPAAVGGFFC
jgi:hypothetical protein